MLIAVFLCLEKARLWPGGLRNKIPASEILRAVLVTASNLLTANINFEKTRDDSMKNRTLKVREIHRNYYLKNQGYRGNPTTSFIQLKGAWLEDAGFSKNTFVSVTVQKNRLILEPQNPN